MSVFRPVWLGKTFLKHQVAKHLVAVRNAGGHWNKDYEPELHPPRTAEEIAAAAKKYNLHPAEYEAYPEDGTGIGDYPKLPDIGADLKDPYYPWDIPELKRNFGETVHRDWDMMGEDRYCRGRVYSYPIGLQLFHFLAVMFGIFAACYLFEQYKIPTVRTPRQFPDQGKVHYTFEFED